MTLRPAGLCLRLTGGAIALASAAALWVVAPAGAGTTSAGSHSHCANAGHTALQLRGSQAGKAVRCLINLERGKRGIRPLAPHRALRRAAGRHTRTMVRTGCFAHRCRGERDLVARLHRSRYLGCRCQWRVAENLAFGRSGRGTPQSIVDSWMRSAGHRTNILDRGFRDLDVGVRRGAPGNPLANAFTYTADFGLRR